MNKELKRIAELAGIDLTPEKQHIINEMGMHGNNFSIEDGQIKYIDSYVYKGKQHDVVIYADSGKELVAKIKSEGLRFYARFVNRVIHLASSDEKLYGIIFEDLER